MDEPVKLYDSMYLVAKRELNDRNRQKQQYKNAPNIPEGTKFQVRGPHVPQSKFTTLVYKNHYYLVKTSDLDVVEAGYYGYKDGENYV